MTVPLIEIQPELAKPFLQEVMERSGQLLTACYQCKRCAAGCPVGDETHFFTPNILIRAVALGDREAALNNELVWKCLSCYTCGTRCPNDIQTARITETLKKMSKEAGIKPLHPKVKEFHDAFFNCGVRWGRVNEVELMGVYELKNTIREAMAMNYKEIFNELRTQARLGASMFKLNRMHFGFETSKGRKEIKALYKKAKEKKKAASSTGSV
jgi:heterodisulfide reductase subunit C2